MPKKPTEGIYQRQDSPYWWASYTNGSGKRVRRSTGVSIDGGKAGEKEAQALLGKWRAEAHQEKQWGRAAPDSGPPQKLFDEAMLEYFRHRVANQRGGMARAKSTAKPLYIAFTGRPLDAITEADIKAYIRHRQAEGKAPGTINKEVGMLSAALNFVREDLGWQTANPSAKKKIKEPEGRVRWLEHEAAVRLIAAASANPRAPWLADFIQFALNTGCRLGEMLGLEWARVDLKTNLVTLDVTKSGKRRSVPLNASAREALLGRARFRAEHCPASPWVFARKDGGRVTTMRRSFKAALEQAGIKDFRIHDQRHTLASWLVMGGTPLAEVRDALGHSTVKMTERYAHLHPENVRAALGRIEGVSRSGHAKEKPAPEKLAK